MSDDHAFDGITIEAMRKKRGAKWQRYGDQVLPCFVADMDFGLALPIHQVLSEQLAAQDYGYTMGFADRPLAEIFAAWAERRFNWTVDAGRIEGLVDVVQGIYLTMHLFTEPGDGVVTLTPTYPPLWQSIDRMGRRLIDSTLVRGTQHYEIDFDDLRSKLDANTKLMLLCNPHNPTGRVFNLIVLADEIHADLVYTPHRHIPFATLSPEIAERTITMTSATKSFNLGGLRFAIAIFGSQALQDRFNAWPKGALGGLNSLGILATETAWRDCDDWLDALVRYLKGNRDFVYDELKSRIPLINVFSPEGTYLAWLGCERLAINPDPFEHFLEAGKVAFSPGPNFGSGGDGFVRMNFATSRSIAGELLDRVVASLPAPTRP